MSRTAAEPPGSVVEGGDADLSVIGAAVADRRRAKMLLALTDGRALPASVLASEAGASASAASAHLRKLCEAGLLQVHVQGRFRYYRLAGDEVGRLVESMARLSPPEPIRSLREGTRAHAVRLARCCYDHIAGRLGVALTDALIDRGYLVGHDGSVDLTRLRGDRIAGGVGDDVTYHLTPSGQAELAEVGVDLPAEDAVRCCVDWTEQRHHIAGRHGQALLRALVANGWVRRNRRSRALHVTDAGKEALQAHLALPWPPPTGAAKRPAPAPDSSSPASSASPAPTSSGPSSSSGPPSGSGSAPDGGSSASDAGSRDAPARNSTSGGDDRQGSGGHSASDHGRDGGRADSHPRGNAQGHGGQGGRAGR